jgi:hypothetical protein
MMKDLLKACMDKSHDPKSGNGRVSHVFIWDLIRDHMHSSGLQLDVLKPSAVNWMATELQKMLKTAMYKDMLPRALATFGAEQVTRLARSPIKFAYVCRNAMSTSVV